MDLVEKKKYIFVRSVCWNDDEKSGVMHKENRK